jgi:hypothetical protein
MEKLKGKFIVAFDTICDGWTAWKGEDEKTPILFDSENEAFAEIFDGNVSMLTNYDKAERKENNVTEKQFKEMQKLLDKGNVKEMRKFLDKYPDCNMYQEFVVPANEYVDGRKAFFTGKGIIIEGTPAKKLF